MQTSKTLRIAVAAALSGAALFGANLAHAAGFALLEQNASGLGNAYAGAAAVAEDASTIYFNSAGLTQLKRPSLVMNAAAINIKSKFHNNASANAALQTSLGSTGGDAGGLTVLPALYVAVPVSDTVSGGIGVNAPFGLKTEYNSDWLGRFQAVKSEVKTTNINTALAFKLHDKVSLGIGADFQTLDATLTSAVNYSAAIASASSGTVLVPNLEGTSKVKGSDSAWGFDAGVLITPTDSTRIGLSYRSALKYKVTGTANFVAPTASGAAQAFITGLSNSTNPAAPTNGPISLDIKLPATARVALAQKLGGSVELLGEVSWTQWSSIPELRIRRSPSGATLKNTPEDWDDTMRYALGANWQVNNGLKLRIGAALDESPVPDSTRTPRLPDNDRTWLSAGAKVDVSKNISVDLGYTHIIAKDAQLNQSDGGATTLGYPYGLINGKQSSDINILGIQATVSF
ncbi:MAG: outer membrane protein transport protein [Steroidobacteraceae bacterium]